MSDMTLKAANERQGWTQPSDIAWTMGYLIVTILLVLLWANVPA
jgi:flagellar biogenesis protein FliO